VAEGVEDIGVVGLDVKWFHYPRGVPSRKIDDSWIRVNICMCGLIMKSMRIS